MVAPLHVRPWNGMSIPTPGVYEIDAQHTTVGFVAQHLMVTQVRGRFEQVEAGIHVARDPLDTFAHASIATASITTGTEDRDNHLKSPDFLDVERFPTMTYVSRELRGGSDRGPKWTMVNGMMRRRRRDPEGIIAHGDLTIKDITQPIDLEVTLDGVTHDPWGGERLAITARGQLDREAYDMKWNVALEAGGWLVSRFIQIEIRAQAIRQE
jgi:polyisoprenoid-binding protein YceI